jgi:hypothetical protein
MSISFLYHFVTVSFPFLYRFRLHFLTVSTSVSFPFPANKRNDKETITVFLLTVSIYMCIYININIICTWMPGGPNMGIPAANHKPVIKAIILPACGLPIRKSSVHGNRIRWQGQGTIKRQGSLANFELYSSELAVYSFEITCFAQVAVDVVQRYAQAGSVSQIFCSVCPVV